MINLKEHFLKSDLDSLSKNISFSRSVDSLAEEDNLSFTKSVRVAVVASSTINGLIESIKADSAKCDLLIKPYLSEYNQFAQEIFNKDSALYNFNPEIVLTLEPTSPFRSLKTINSAIDALRDGKSDSVLAVKETTECIGKIINNSFEHILKNQPRRRQDRDPLYVESSTIYGTLSKILIKNRSVLGKNPFPIIVDKYESIDINEKLDLIVAESYIKLLNYT